MAAEDAESPPVEPEAVADEAAEPEAPAPDLAPSAPDEQGAEADGRNGPEAPGAREAETPRQQSDTVPDTPPEPQPAHPKLDAEDPESFTSLTTERQNADQFVAAAARGATAAGIGASAFYIEHMTVSGEGDRQVDVVLGRFREEDIERQLDAFVSPAGFDSQALALQAQGVAYVTGEEGSGRTMHGLGLLASVCPAQFIVEITILDETILSIVTSQQIQFEAEHGYLISLSGRPISEFMLRALATKAAAAKSFVVVLDNRTQITEDLLDYAIDHVKPLFEEVFERHLQVAQAEHVRLCRDGCTKESLSRHVEEARAERTVVRQLDIAAKGPVRMTARLAKMIVLAVHVGFKQVVDEPEDTFRELGREILATEDPHVQSMRISYAVFNGLLLTDVFDAELLLRQGVLPKFEQRESEPQRLVSDGRLDDLMHPKMIERYRRGEDGEQRPRRARLSNEELTFSILEVAWHEYDTLRKPLLTWLRELAGFWRMSLRVRAAVVAGWLATQDFDEVYRDLIGPLATGKAVQRQAAALAMEVAYTDKRLENRVRARVYDWARSSNVELQDCAARCLGTKIGIDGPAQALDSLRDLGSRQNLAVSASVAASMTWLFLTSSADAVLGAIGEWIRSDNEYLRFHAVRTLLYLVRLRRSEDGSWTTIEEMAAADQDHQEALVHLWRGALTNHSSAMRAWRALGRWLLRSDANPSVTPVVLEICRGVLVPPLRSRALFNLQIEHTRSPDSPTIRGVYQFVQRGE